MQFILNVNYLNSTGKCFTEVKDFELETQKSGVKLGLGNGIFRYPQVPTADAIEEVKRYLMNETVSHSQVLTDAEEDIYPAVCLSAELKSTEQIFGRPVYTRVFPEYIHPEADKLLLAQQVGQVMARLRALYDGQKFSLTFNSMSNDFVMGTEKIKGTFGLNEKTVEIEPMADGVHYSVQMNYFGQNFVYFYTMEELEKLGIKNLECRVKN